MQGVRAQDPGALRALVDQTSGLLFTVAHRLLHDATEAEDVVQETYVIAWQTMHRLRDATKVKSWLSGIVRHRAKDVLRSRRRRPSVSLDVAAVGETLQALEGEDDDALARLQQQDAQRVLQQALADIPERFRLPLLLKEVDGLSGQEIADFLGIPVGTVESRATRGRQKLARRLAREKERLS